MGVREREVLIGDQEANFRDNHKLKYERSLDLVDKTRIIFEHALRQLAK